METEIAEVEKECRTTLAYLRNAKTAESSDQCGFAGQTPKTMILLYLFLLKFGERLKNQYLEKYLCSEAI
ncbi:hypothetical protein ACG9ZB_04220 [Acinetobacter johnsonii]|uniref:hypothetical protein n=1 Tax=Acinetobacter johnsonii TaxID=40214 RepID=UPI003AF9CFA2